LQWGGRGGRQRGKEIYILSACCGCLDDFFGALQLKLNLIQLALAFVELLHTPKEQKNKTLANRAKKGERKKRGKV
jgi:hypothetical protein